MLVECLRDCLIQANGDGMVGDGGGASSGVTPGEKVRMHRKGRERRGSKASVILTEAEISRCKDFIHYPFIHFDTHPVSLINLILYCITKESGRIELIWFISVFLFLYVAYRAEPAGIFDIQDVKYLVTSIRLIACLRHLTDTSFNYKSATTPHKDNTYLAAYIY